MAFGLFDALRGEDLIKSAKRQRLASFQKTSLPVRTDDHEQSGSLYPSSGETKRNGQQSFDLTERDLPQPIRDKIENKWLGPTGISREEATQNLRDTLASATPDHWSKGLPWYQQAHDNNVEKGQQYGVHPEIYHAMTSAISPNTDWNENQHATESLARQLPAYNHIKDPDQLTAMLVPSLGHAGAYQGYPASISRAIQLYRHGLPEGSPDEDYVNHIDQTLGGNKTRSFYNNMSDPEGNGNDVTIDKHMIMAMLAGDRPEEHRRMARENYLASATDGGSNPQYQNAQLGIHPMAADMVRQVTAEYNQKNGTNYSPAQIQAVIWHREKDRSDDFTNTLKSENMKRRVPNRGTLDETGTDEEVF